MFATWYHSARQHLGPRQNFDDTREFIGTNACTCVTFVARLTDDSSISANTWLASTTTSVGLVLLIFVRAGKCSLFECHNCHHKCHQSVITIGHCGTLWDTVGRCRTLGHCGTLWDTVGHRGTPWDTVGHRCLKFFLAFRTLLGIFVSYSVLQCLTVPHSVTKCPTVSHSVPLLQPTF